MRRELSFIPLLVFWAHFSWFANLALGRAATMSLPPSQLSVSRMDSAICSIAMALPRCSFRDCGSTGNNDLLGVGWSFGALPSIAVCRRAVAEGSVVGRGDYDADERFCMEGRRLSLVSGAYGAKYRTELEVYPKIASPCDWCWRS
jgi:hypothetical protein